MTVISSEDERRWRALVEHHRAFVLARMDLRQKGESLVELVARGLNEPSERATALDLLQSLSEEDRKRLFPDVLAVAAYGHGLTDEAIRALHALPKDWVLENVEAAAEPLLREGTDEEYRMILRLYAELSLDLARALALRALAHEGQDIREAGEDFQQAHVENNEAARLAEESRDALYDYETGLIGHVSHDSIVRLPGEPTDLQELLRYVHGESWMRRDEPPSTR